MIKMILRIILLWLLIIIDVKSSENDLSVCTKNVEVVKSNEYKIQVENVSLRQLKPHFFGFNLNWFGFQGSYWNNKENKITDRVIGFLKRDFSGAVYRYPGGHVSNRFDWESSIGSYENRAYQKPVKWHEPLISKFGYQEYLDFTNLVGGKPWVVTNLYGKLGKEEPIEILAGKAGKWAKYSVPIQQNVERWELGNELDRGEYNWTAEKYSKRAKEIEKAIKLSLPNSKFVVMLRDYHIGERGLEGLYNRKIATNHIGQDYEYALHQYYDGPSVRTLTSHLCSSISEIKKQAVGDVFIWITEHGVWPNGKKPINWEIEKFKTYNLKSAISVADYVISVSRIPEVNGAFYHALSFVNGPWSLFHEVDNNLRPSVVYRALKLLRDTMLPVVLDSDIYSRNDSKYYGGYDIRASVQTNDEQTKYNIWLINRAKNEASITLKVPNLVLEKKNAIMTSIFDDDLNTNNIDNDLSPVSKELQLSFNRNGEVELMVPGQSISSIVVDE